MKKIILLLSLFLFLACGKNNDEDNHYGYGLPQEQGPQVRTYAPVDLNSWMDLEGTYQLKSFDGNPVSGITTIVQYNYYSNLVNPNNSQEIRLLAVPLYYELSKGSAFRYGYGPFDGLGESFVEEDHDIKTYYFAYRGPLQWKMGKKPFEINLKIKLVKTKNQLQIDYNVEEANEPPQSHSIVLEKE